MEFENFKFTHSTYLEEIVHGDPEEQEISEVLKDVESTVDNPVGQPLSVVVTLRTLNCFEPAKVSTLAKLSLCVILTMHSAAHHIKC